jgi:hypothetical protein
MSWITASGFRFFEFPKTNYFYIARLSVLRPTPNKDD